MSDSLRWGITHIEYDEHVLCRTYTYPTREEAQKKCRGNDKVFPLMPTEPQEPVAWRGRKHGTEWQMLLDKQEADDLRQSGWEVQALYPEPVASLAQRMQDSYNTRELKR